MLIRKIEQIPHNELWFQGQQHFLMEKQVLPKIGTNYFATYASQFIIPFSSSCLTVQNMSYCQHHRNPKLFLNGNE